MERIKKSWTQILYSLLFSAMIIVQRHIILNTDSCFSATLDKVRIIPYSWLDVIGYIVVALAVYCISLLIIEQTEKITITTEGRSERKRNLRVYFAIVITLIVFWLPYLLSYFPSGVYTDTYNVIQQARGVYTLTNHHPVLYTGLWKLSLMIGNLFGNGQEYIVVFSVFQCLVVAFVLSAFIYWLYKIGANRKTLILVLLFYAVVPLTPQYVISLWKDTLFCIVLFAYTFIILKFLYGVENDYDKNGYKKFVVFYGICGLLLMFIRNNGRYIVLFTSIVIAIFLTRKPQKSAKLFLIVVGIELVITMVIQGPVYDRLGLNVDEKVESYAVPMQQVSYIVCTDGNTTEDERHFVDQIIPIESLKATYNPLSFDQTKWNRDFNTAFFNENTRQFFKVYLGLVLKNPRKAIEAWLLETYGFWATDKTTGNGYLNITMWYTLDGLYQDDLVNRFTGINVKELLAPRGFISYAVLLWIMLFAVTLIHRRNSRLLIAFLPSLFGWTTIMIATPCAYSFRYVYFLYQLLPMYLYISFSMETGRKIVD